MLLNKYSYDKICENFTNYVSTTYKMVHEARVLLNDIDNKLQTKKYGCDDLNKLLGSYYTIIPRAMKHTKSHKFYSFNVSANVESARKLILSEFDLLNTLNTQLDLVKPVVKDDGSGNEKINILDSLGITMEVVDEKEIAFIKQKMKNYRPNGTFKNDDSGKFVRAFKVVNKKTEKLFNEKIARSKNKTVEHYWHGSRNENWLSILKSGLLTNPTKAKITAKMFGFGIYFADSFRKSYGYTSGRGSYFANGSSKDAFLSLYKVHTGKAKRITKWKYEHKRLNADKIGNNDSVFAPGGYDNINNEFIVYEECQTTIEYIVQVSG